MNMHESLPENETEREERTLYGASPAASTAGAFVFL